MWRHRTAVLTVALSLIAAPVWAEDEAPDEPKGLFDREALTGDWGGWRQRLEDRGIQIGADYVGETLANPVGGRSRTGVAEGRFEFFTTVDLEKALDWKGAQFHANVYRIDGRGLSTTGVGNLMTVSNIEAQRATRLFALWLQQELFDRSLSIRAGQIAADDEFFVSQYAATFINSTFGWPVILGSTLPGGGAVYPAATPGVRVKGAVSDDLSLSAAIFGGDPAGPGTTTTAAATNDDGTNFRLGNAALIISEAAYQTDIDPDGFRLPGTYKLGAWYHTGRFADQRQTSAGLSLADPAGSGQPSIRRGNYGLYAIADQKLWHEPDAVEQGIGMFLRLAGAPADRNLIDYYADTGVTYKGIVPGRDDDTAGLSFAFARVSEAAQAADRDSRFFTGVDRPGRDYEAVIELTYQAQVAPWWILQPDLQYIVHPGARVAAPDDPAGTRPVPNALVIGLRTGIVF